MQHEGHKGRPSDRFAEGQGMALFTQDGTPVAPALRQLRDEYTFLWPTSRPRAI